MLDSKPKDTATQADKSTLTRWFPWVRLWVDLPTEPKFRTVARSSKQPLTAVLSVFIFLLTDAANAVERGTQDADPEDIASALDLDPEAVEAILEAMQGRLLDGQKLTGWATRQPEREDGSAERSRAWRERNRTQPNAGERNRTPQRRGEKSREEDKNQNHLRGRATFDFHDPALLAGKPGSPAPLPVAGGTEAHCTDEHLTELTRCYPGVKVHDEFGRMRAWLLSNPERRKTSRGIAAFVARWLGKAQDSARGSGSTAPAHRRTDEDAAYKARLTTRRTA